MKTLTDAEIEKVREAFFDIVNCQRENYSASPEGRSFLKRLDEALSILSSPHVVAEPVACSPQLTVCPKCNNDISKCTGLFAAPQQTAPVTEAKSLSVPEVLAFGCKKETDGGAACLNWCGNGKDCGHVLRNPQMPEHIKDKFAFIERGLWIAHGYASQDRNVQPLANILRSMELLKYIETLYPTPPLNTQDGVDEPPMPAHRKGHLRVKGRVRP